MAKTSRDAARHIRELSRLFADTSAIGGAVMEDMLRRHQRRRYLKQSLRRLIERGFLRKRDGQFVPTIAGKRFFRRFTTKQKQKERWDGKWRIVSFDVPGGYNRKRNQLRALLHEFGFQPLQKSVWISPNYVADEFWKLIVKEELEKYCRCMLVEIMEGDQELKKLFKLGEAPERAAL